MCLNVRFTPSRVRTPRDNAERITENVKSRTKVFVSVAELK